jgi:CBS domain-containing protein
MSFDTDTQTPERILADTVVRDAMHPGVVTCPPETPLRDVAVMMARYGIHAVVVFTDDDDAGTAGVWGVVSDSDLVAAAAVHDVSGRTAGGTARTPLVAVRPNDSLERVAELMKEHRVAHVVVVTDESERPVGVVSTLDVARCLAHGSRS